MSEARIETVYEDRVRGREFLRQAEVLHNATIAACDAILQTAGLRVTGGEGGHVLRIETALARLPGETALLLEELDASRERRAGASYAALPVASASVDEARVAVSDLVGRAKAFVGE